MSYQLLQSNYTLIHNLQPAPIGMNLTLVRQLLQHKDLVRILEKVKENGQKTLITVHHNVEKYTESWKEQKRMQNIIGGTPFLDGHLLLQAS